VLVAVASFAVGFSAGLHKARFSYRFGENYERNFVKGRPGDMPMMDQGMLRGIKLGAYDFLEKPFAVEKLALTLEKCFEVKKLNEEKNKFKSQLIDTQFICYLCKLRAKKPLLSIPLLGNSGPTVTPEPGIPTPTSGPPLCKADPDVKYCIKNNICNACGDQFNCHDSRSCDQPLIMYSDFQCISSCI
jgi:hypothetical protein